MAPDFPKKEQGKLERSERSILLDRNCDLPTQTGGLQNGVVTEASTQSKLQISVKRRLFFRRVSPFEGCAFDSLLLEVLRPMG